MSASNVSICNTALTALSSSRIVALTEDSENARKCNAIFETVRDDLLEQHNWNFAKRQKALGLLTTSPILDWDFSFQLPTDCIRVMRLQYDADFQVYGDKLYTNESEATIEYFAQITNPAEFSKGFVSALAARIARDLAYGISQSSTVQAAMEVNYKAALANAKASDAQAGTPQPVRRSRLKDARGRAS